MRVNVDSELAMELGVELDFPNTYQHVDYVDSSVEDPIKFVRENCHQPRGHKIVSLQAELVDMEVSVFTGYEFEYFIQESVKTIPVWVVTEQIAHANGEQIVDITEEKFMELINSRDHGYRRDERTGEHRFFTFNRGGGM